MATHIDPMGKGKLVIKTTRPWGRVFANPPAWDKTIGGEIPDAVKARNKAFTAAAKACAGKSKKFGIKGVSEYNLCIGQQLKK